MSKAKIFAAAAVCLASFAAFGETDLTALGRTEFTPTVTRVSGSVRKNTEDVNHAFDGDTGKNGRVMFTTGTGAIQYDIPNDYQQGAEFTLTSYKLMRTHEDDSYDLPRAPTQFKLEAFDGSAWVTLHEKTASDPETSWSATVQEIVYEIPAANRIASRSYRFSMYANNGSTHEARLSLNDLTFYADVVGGVQIIEEAALVAECGIEKELYFENRKLTDVQDLAMTCKQGFGGSQDERDYRWSLPKVPSGTFADSGLYLLSNDGTTLTVEFHGRTYGSSYDGVGNGFLLQLTQEGDDIYGQVMWAAGFTGAQTFGYDVSWEPKKGKISDYYNTTALYHSYGRNLRLYFSDASSQARTVYFKGKDGETIKTYIVQPGEYAAVGPTDAEMPDYGSNWVFLGWDKPFDNVQKLELVVTALYHKLCTVTFMGGVDGQTKLDQQTVEQTHAATAPEAPEIPNYVFIGWDADFSCIEDDLVVTAIYDRTYRVVFKNPDGSVIDTQSVRTGFAASAPDMTGVEYQGLPFFSWIGDFSSVTSDLEITAYYGLRPDFAKHFTVTIPENYSQGSCETYQILVRMSEAGISGFSYDDFLLDGRDIYVEDASGGALPFELASWNTDGESLLYVQVTSELDGSDITVSYGGAMAVESPEGMWEGYAGVWHMEENSGDVADATGHGLTATPHGVTEQMVASDDAVIGRARVNATATGTANGMGVSADINNYITTASSFTVEGWFKATGVNGYTRVFSRKNSQSAVKGFEIEYDSGSKTTGKFTGKGSSPRLNFTTADTTAGWQKLTYVVNGATASVYTNGALSATGSITAVEAAEVGFSIGNDADFNERQWWGLYDEVKFYDGAKSAAQIAFEYAQDAGVAEPLVYGAAAASDTSKPDVVTVSISSADGETMTISLGLTTIGDDASSAEAYIAYGPDAENLCTPVKFAEGTGSPLVGTIGGLDANATYVYSIHVENDAGQVSEAKTGSFRVAATTVPVANPLSTAGLMQGKINAANDFSTDILANSVIPPEIVPGVVMALYKVDSGKENSVFYTSPYTGHEFKWNTSNTTFGYYGEIYLPAGELHIGKNIDDSAYVKIGDTVLVNNTAYDAFPVGTLAVERAGWYPLEVRIGDGSGGKGITNASKFENNGLAYNIDGTTDPAESGWAPLMDSDGGFLRYVGDGGSCLAIGPVTVGEDKSVSVWLSVDGEVPSAASLVAVYAAEDKGEVPMAWNSRIVLAELAKGETLVSTKFTLPNLAKYGAVRFALLTEATETSPALSQFSALYEYEQILPLVSLRLGEITEEGVSVTVSAETFGAGADSAALKLEYSLAADFASSGFITVGDCTEPGEIAFDITTLEPATTYFVRAVLENSAGEIGVSNPITFTTYNSAIAHPGETLTWIGGASGTWDDATANWLSPNGYQVAWVDGCTAKFTEDTAVNLSAPRTVLGIEVGANVIVTGDAITFAAPATITHTGGTTLRFENDVKGTDGLNIPSLEITCPSVFGTDVCILEDGDGKDQASTESTVWFRNVQLSEIDNIRGTMFGKHGSFETTLTFDAEKKATGTSNIAGQVFFFENDGETLTAEFQMQPYAYGKKYMYCIKVELTQNGADVNGRVVYRKYSDSGNGLGVESWDDYPANDGLSCHLYDVQLIKKPTMAVEIAGDYQATGTLSVNAGAFRVVGSGKLGGGTMKAPVFLADGTVYEFASDFAQTFKGPINMTGRGSGTTTSGRFVIAADASVTIDCSAEYEERIFVRTDIYGDVYVKDGNYHDYYMNTKGIYVHDGGTMSLGSGYGVYGHRNWKVFVEAGGTVIYRNKQNAGLAEDGTQILGGEIQFPTDYSANPQDNFFTKLVMQDGARVTGKMYTWAYGNHTHEIGGASPSFIETEKVRVGRTGDCNQWKDYTVGSGAKCIETLNVSDVTGDAEADLVVSSELYANPYTRFTADTAQYFGVAKKGAGTVEFTGTSTNFNASLMMESGSVAFGSDAKFNAYALIVTGDSTLSVEPGAEVAFADSSAQTWTAGRTVAVEGSLSGHALRFGTDENGLTEEQLAAISVGGKKGRVFLNAKGYLRTKNFTTMLMK